jgi:hypothetical protein
MPKEQTKTEKYHANMRTFYLTDSNLNIIKLLNEIILSSPNMTKLINYALDGCLGKIAKNINKSKTPKERENKIVKFTMEVKEYANTEEVIS